MRKINQKAIILGGTNAHIALIQNLKQRGFHTLLIDHYAISPSKPFVDEHIQMSWHNTDAVIKLAKDRHVTLVIATSVDQANVTACYVSEKLGLPCPYSFNSVNLISNKIQMKRKFVDFGVPTAKYYEINNIEEITNIHFENAWVVKPADCGGSKGVRKVTNKLQLIFAAEEAFKLSKNHEIIVEEFCEGIEYSADCFINDGNAHVLLIREKHIHKGNQNTVLCSIASVTPPVNFSDSLFKKIEEVAQSIASGFNLQSTAMLIQFIVTNGIIYVLEFAPRTGGGLGPRVVELQTGFDIIDATINTYLGHPVTIALSKPSSILCAHHIYAHPGIMGEINNADLLLEEGYIDELYIHKTTGDEIGESFSSSDRPASFIATADNYDLLVSKINHVFSTLDIFNKDGKSIIQRNIHIGSGIQ